MKILIAEDELDIREMLKASLSREGYQIVLTKDGKEAWDTFTTEKFDLCIFDIMMPEINGINLLIKIREISEVPIIFLTAKTEEENKVLSLTLGADDYLVKPFSLAELKARIQVQKRHALKAESYSNNIRKDNNLLICGDLQLNTMEAKCTKNSELISLGAKEYLLLKLFMENQERVFTKKQLYSAVWQDSFLYDDNTVTVHMSRLRSKIESNSKKPMYLLTIRGIGYKLSNQSISNNESKNES